MEAALFCTSRYEGPARHDVWPAPTDRYEAEWAERSMARALEQFRLADAVGFDWVTVAEHHFAPFSITPNPMVLAAALAENVKRAKIAILGPDIPILDPVRVAEEIAMVDTLSGGRVVAGLMRGTPNEYVTYNINPAESRGRFEEALQLIRMAWTETQPFGWQGRYYQYRSICIWPRPVQQPYPKIYVSAASPESAEFAARLRLGAGYAFTTRQLAGEAARHYRECCRAHGWEATPGDIVYRVAMHMAETDDAALDDLRTAAGSGGRVVGVSMRNREVEAAVADSGYYGSDKANQRGRLSSRGDLAARIENGQILVGGPETVIGQIVRLREQIGAGVLDITIAHQMGDKTLRSIELFGTKVLPRIRDM